MTSTLEWATPGRSGDKNKLFVDLSKLFLGVIRIRLSLPGSAFSTEHSNILFCHLMLVFLEILILLLVGMYNGEHKYFYLDKVFLQIFLFEWKKNLVAITLHMRSRVSHGVTPPSPSSRLLDRTPS